MKYILSILFLLVLTPFQLCDAQTGQTSLLKVDNYNKGELELKIISFGEEDPITIGKVSEDGTIHLDWPELDLNNMGDRKFYSTSIKSLIRTKYCNDPSAIITNEDAKLIENKFLYLFKYGQRVGCIIPSTQQGQEHRIDQLGSTIYWIYSDEEITAKANCKAKKEWEELYSFEETTAYDLTLKKGWNMVSHTLSEIEEYDNGTGKRSLPKTTITKSIDQIPTDIHWHLKYWANDELLDLEQRLMASTPLTKEHFQKWLPENLGKLDRASYEIDKQLERMPKTNNINLLFENGTKKVDLTIVDCAGNKKAASMFTLMQDMASRDWNDKTETGYRSASKLDNNRVLTEYHEKEAKTILSYNTHERFLVKAEASNIEPKELWKYLQELNLDSLIKG